MTTLKVGIASYDEMKARTLRMARGEQRPARDEPKIWFTSTESFAKLLSANNRELLRVIDGLQLTDKLSVATPANWKDGQDVIIVPSLQDPEVLKQKFPKGYTALKPYLRVTPQPNK